MGWAFMAGSGIGLVSDVERGMIDVTVCGQWDGRLRSELSVGLRQCFAEHPRAVRVDVAGLDDPAGGFVSTVLAARDVGAAMDPPVPLVCCAARGELARHIDDAGLATSMAVYASVAQARAELDERLGPALQWRTEFPSTYTAVALARDMVSQACSRWGLVEVVHQARLLVSELATNAVDHAAGHFAGHATNGFVVTLSRRGPSLLHIAVQDDTDTLPHLRRPGPTRVDAPFDERGWGLTVVAARATDWGTMPCVRGKVVWATVRVPLPDRR
jgi:anti-sigma regulatory factor (Ser/Thr protein kinase)